MYPVSLINERFLLRKDGGALTSQAAVVLLDHTTRRQDAEIGVHTVVYVSVSYSCCNKIPPQTWGPKATQTYCPMILEVRRLTQGGRALSNLSLPPPNTYASLLQGALL